MHSGNRSYIPAYLLLLAAVVLLLGWNVAAGSVSVPLGELGQILRGQATEHSRIVLSIRMPRAVAALLLGGALAVAGFLLQTFFANPIAGPFVLGISSGAKLAVALVMLALLGRGHSVGSWALIGAAFVGSMAAMGFILLLSRYVRSPSLLVVGGVMIGYICSAVTDFLVTFAEDASIANLHSWSMGSFSGITWENAAVMAAVVGAALAAAFLLSKPIGAYQLGEVYARSLGVNIPLLRLALIVLSSLLAACVTAFAGPVSFVGIAVPHLVKRLIGTARPIAVIPACFLGGGAFCLLCDLIARTLLAPTELSISSVTAVFGAPIVLLLMARGRERGAAQ